MKERKKKQEEKAGKGREQHTAPAFLLCLLAREARSVYTLVCEQE